MHVTRKTAPLLTLAAALAALGLAAPQSAQAQGFTGPYELQNFTATATNGTATITPSSGPSSTADFTYNYNNTPYGVGNQTYTFSTLAAAPGTVTFNYNYTGYSAFAGAYEQANLVDFTTNTTVPLVPYSAPGGVFSYTGTGALPVNSGDQFGVQLLAGNNDSDSRVYGTFHVSNFAAPMPAPEPSSVASFGLGGLGLLGLMVKARKRK